MTIRGKAYIAGVYEHPLREATGKTVPQLHAEVAKGALEDAIVCRRPATRTHPIFFLGVGPRPACQCNQRNFAVPRCNGLGGVIDMDNIGRAACLGTVDLAQVKPHVLGLVDTTHTGYITSTVVSSRT